MASPQAEAIKAQQRAFREAVLGGADAPPTLAQMRAGGEQAGAMGAPADGVHYEWVTIGDGLRALWAVPDGASLDAVIQYVHGGGYVVCSAESHRGLVGHLAKAAGVRVLSVDYRLAPESPHPGPVNDSVAAYRWLLGQGIAPSRIAISGDSAGGGLTVATLLALRDAGDPLPACAAPISPWVDLEGTGESMTTRAAVDLIVGKEGLLGMAALFLQGGDPRDPLAAPLHADLSGLPPLYIQVGDEETLLDDSTRLAANARRDGVEVQLEVVPEMQHVFQLAAGVMPEADDALARLGGWIRDRLT
jgi:monoterpene epsilon-lactone hydrolase